MVGSSVVTIAFGDEFILPALHSDIDSDFSSIFFFIQFGINGHVGIAV